MDCPVCGHNKSLNLKNYQKDYLSKCLKCSLVFSNKKPTKKELDSVYSNYNYESVKPTEFTLLKIRKTVKKLFSLNNPKNVLDIGCGNALFLDEFKKLGCKTFATEYDSRLSEIAIRKGHSIVDQGLYPKLKNGTKIDMIIFTEVIEHITEQKKCLSHFFDILSNNGIIYITTPNFSSLERRIFKDKWQYICYPEHLCYFTSKSLDDCMSRFRFEKIYNFTENISISAIQQYFSNTEDTVKTINQQDKIQNFANKSRLLSLFKPPVNLFLKYTNLGSGIRAAYKKSN